MQFSQLAFHLLGFAVVATIAPAQPVRLEAPALAVTDSVSTAPHPTWAWAEVPAAHRYEVAWSRNATFMNPVSSDVSDVSRYVSVQPLAEGRVFWRVRALGEDGAAGPWSNTATHRIVGPRATFDVPATADQSAIQRILEAAAASSPALVRFAAGATYRLSPVDHAFVLKDTQDVIVDGQGATFLITQPSAGLLRCERSRGLTFQNFIVDYDPLPHVVARVESVTSEKNRAFLHLRPESGYPDFDAAHVRANWSWGVVLDPDVTRRGWMKAHAPLVANFARDSAHRSASDPAVFRVALTKAGEAIHYSPNDRIILFARKNGHELFGHRDCSDITYYRVTVHACPAGHINFQNGTDLKVLSFRAVPREGRWFAGNADGVHVRGSEVGPWVEDCTFDSLGDDAIALYNKGIAIVSHSSDRIVLDRAFMDLRVGDGFRIFDPRTGTLIGSSYRVLELRDRPVGIEVRFAPALPRETKLVSVQGNASASDQVFNLSRRNDGFVVRRNVFRAIRRYGTVFRSSHGVITDNQYLGSSNAAIALLNEPELWRNGLGGEQVLIARNQISQVSFDGSARDVGAIEVVWRKLQGVGSGILYRDISIVENDLSGWGDHAIALRNTRGFAISGNRIHSPGSSSSDNRRIGILIEDSEDGRVAESTRPSGHTSVKSRRSKNIQITDDTP